MMTVSRCLRDAKYQVLSFYKVKMENRIDWIDVAKGIAIILVVAGHVGYPTMGKAVIYSFHMPLLMYALPFPEQALLRIKDIRPFADYIFLL